MNRSFRLALLSAFLAACASTSELTSETSELTDQHWTTLDAASLCCESLQSVAFVPMADADMRFELGNGPVRQFDTGRSHFHAIDFGRISNTSVLVIKAHQNLHRRGAIPSMIRPSYFIVDQQRRPLTGSTEVPLCYAQGWGKRETGHFGLIPLDRVKGAGLVVFTSRTNQGRSTPFRNQATTAGGGVVMDFNVAYDFPATPVGDLELLHLDDDLREHLSVKCPQLFASE